jgi:hypothetical protein
LRRRLAAISLLVVASVTLVPAAAFATWSRGHGHRGGRPPRTSFARPIFPHRPNFPSRHHFFRPFAPLVVLGSPVVVYTPPPVSAAPIYREPIFVPPPVYAPPPVYGPPAGAAIQMAPPPPPMPTVVHYPTGRYELRGDGIAIPYTWVWIPNPPPPPPPSAPPAGGPASENPPPARRTPLYRWTDADDVVHWTDRLDRIPERYRPGAQWPPG